MEDEIVGIEYPYVRSAPWPLHSGRADENKVRLKNDNPLARKVNADITLAVNQVPYRSIGKRVEVGTQQQARSEGSSS